MGGFEGGASGGITWKASLLSNVENVHRMLDLKLHRHNYKPVEQISTTCCSNIFDSFLVLISVKPKPLIVNYFKYHSKVTKGEFCVTLSLCLADT